MDGQKKASYAAIKGVNDVLPNHADPFLDSDLWREIAVAAGEVTTSFGYAQVWLPTIEETALFTRGLGEQTDVVAKEMYSFTDRGERNISLRPEGTAGGVRAYVQHHLGRNEPQQRWFYFGPMFRAERPQKGRYRQFYQLGAECFGLRGPGVDVEMVQMLQALLARLGLTDVRLRVNTLGDGETRHRYREALLQYARAHLQALCASCQARAAQNPLRLLDCKSPACAALMADAPDIEGVLTSASQAWWTQYRTLLDALHIPYVRDKQLVRGLDYYTEAIFEFTTGDLGAQDAVAGGGRYDNLVAELGGPATPAVGFAAGVERLALLLSAQRTRRAGPALFVAVQRQEATAYALRLASQLRAAGLAVEVGSDDRLKASLKRADRSRARALLVLGDNELQSGEGQLKRMDDGTLRPTRLQPAELQANLAALLAN